MKTEKKERKFTPELPKEEILGLKKTAKLSSEKTMIENVERMKKADADRPVAMWYFDELALFKNREKELLAEKVKGKKVIGYQCLFAPTELVLAADAIPVRVNSGWFEASKLGELLSDYKPVWAMNIPKIKNSPNSLRFWNDEIRQMKKQLEDFTGNKITRKSLRDAIEQTQRATRVFRRLQDLRKGDPIIMGRDAMLVNQAYTWDDKKRWTEKTETLCKQLEERVQRKAWVCPPETPRVMLTGTPMFWPDNWKLPSIVEEANPRGIIVADELCSGERILNDPVGVDEWSMDDMLKAIGDRYLMASTCPCLTSKDGNEDRVNWILNKIKEWRVQGVIYCVVRGCMPYAMEYSRIKKALDKINIPVYYLDTDYTREDAGQLKTRIEAFLEMLTARLEI